MELLDGVDLRTLVERNGPVAPARAVHFLRQACESLSDAHRHGLIHRDIKPANLFACRIGLDHDFVKVLDFGLVKEAARNGDATAQLTLEGVASGTPGFMAPEMAGGEQALDGRSDLYALGCVAYWLLTGELVFPASTAMAMLVRHAKDAPAAPSSRSEHEVPDVLDRIVLDCLAKDPGGRPASADELLRRLDEAAAVTGAWTRQRAERWWQVHHPTGAA
jgi:serine/threonine-protein kinase